MSQFESHRNLLVWQAGLQLAEAVYRLTATFPNTELFGLTAQMRRSATSIPCNIAEGAGRNSRKELAQYLGIASGSRAELETQLELAYRLGYLDRSNRGLEDCLNLVGRLLVGLRRSIRDPGDSSLVTRHSSRK